MGELYRRYAATHAHTSVVDLKPIVCPDDPCSNQTPEGEAIRSDGLHYTRAGVDLIAPRLTEAIIGAARSTGVPPPTTGTDDPSAATSIESPQ